MLQSMGCKESDMTEQLNCLWCHKESDMTKQLNSNKLD